MEQRSFVLNTVIFYQSGISDIVNMAAMSITGFLATIALYKSYKIDLSYEFIIRIALFLKLTGYWALN